jgi:hypothetical protein
MNTHLNQSRDASLPRTSSPRTSSEEALIEPAGDFAAALRHFRSAVHHIAERETSQPVPAGWLIPAKRRQRSAQRSFVLAWSLVTTSAALLCVGALPLLHRANPAVHEPPAAAVQSDADDTALLEQVDSAVSESVPSSLAPLAALDSWSSTTASEAATESSLKPEKKNVTQ